MRAVTKWLAFDETPFDSAEECKAYEAKHVEGRLVGLTAEQVAAAIDRGDPELADAIEQVAGRIARARREAGDLKRGRKAADTAETKPEAAGPPDEEMSPAYRGDRDFKAGMPGIIPDDLRDDKAKSEEYLAAWDAASVASFNTRKAAGAKPTAIEENAK